METKTKEIELEAFFLSELKPDIHFVRSKSMVLTKAHYEEIIKQQMLMSGGKKVGVIVDAGSVKMVTHDAGRYVRSIFPEFIWGTAIIVQKPIAKMVVSFFLNVIKPVFPAKAFPDFESANKWINQLRSEQ